MSTTFTIPRGPHYGGCVVRVETAEPSRLSTRAPAPYVAFHHPASTQWQPAPLRTWAAVFPKESSLWSWLKSNGVRRPSKSGTRTSGTPRADRPPSVEVALGAVARAKLDQGEASGLTRSQCIDAALRAWSVPKVVRL